MPSMSFIETHCFSEKAQDAVDMPFLVSFYRSRNEGQPHARVYKIQKIRKSFCIGVSSACVINSNFHWLSWLSHTKTRQTIKLFHQFSISCTLNSALKKCHLRNLLFSDTLTTPNRSPQNPCFAAVRWCGRRAGFRGMPGRPHSLSLRPKGWDGCSRALPYLSAN